MKVSNNNLKLKILGIQDYKKTWASMLNIILSRSKDDPDEVWVLEHPPVFTLGFGASRENLLIKNIIPVVRSDRGGEVTYHGPGQLVVYFMLNLRRLGWGPKKLVNELEELIISLLKQYEIPSYRKPKEPGVYVEQKKIASIGLKIKRGYSYHGLSLNVKMDLKPFENINVCGNKSLQVTHLSNFKDISLDQVKTDLLKLIKERFASLR